MNGILDTTCMHDWHGSISKLCSRVDLLCPQAFSVSCIDRVDRTEVLLKLIFGPKDHAYDSSTYPINIPLYSIKSPLTALQGSEHASTAVHEVGVLLLCTRQCRTNQLKHFRQEKQQQQALQSLANARQLPYLATPPYGRGWHTMSQRSVGRCCGPSQWTCLSGKHYLTDLTNLWHNSVDKKSLCLPALHNDLSSSSCSQNVVCGKPTARKLKRVHILFSTDRLLAGGKVCRLTKRTCRTGLRLNYSIQV